MIGSVLVFLFCFETWKKNKSKQINKYMSYIQKIHKIKPILMVKTITKTYFRKTVTFVSVLFMVFLKLNPKKTKNNVTIFQDNDLC